VSKHFGADSWFTALADKSGLKIRVIRRNPGKNVHTTNTVELSH
jgi:hypothetical protein